MKKGVLFGIIGGVAALAICGGILTSRLRGALTEKFNIDTPDLELGEEEPESESTEAIEEVVDNEVVATIGRPSFIRGSLGDGMPSYTPSVEPYQVDADLANVINKDRWFLQDHQIQALVDNNFYVADYDYYEFYEVYENNRYGQDPNFITTDSIMHTYHLYYSYLQKKTERDFLADKVSQMSKDLLEQSKQQYNTLKGTEWEEAALRNYAFFTIGNDLMNGSKDADAEVKDIVSDELALIDAADGVMVSSLTEDYEDYTQYIPRGYYTESEVLTRYFKAMMWYGRRNFAQKSESLNKSALLMTLALRDVGTEDWDSVYTVTSFFAGSSDDSGYYEYEPLIEQAYGKDITVEGLIGNDDAFQKYTDLTAKVDPPAINSVPFDDDQGKTDKNERAKGYRLMGQRFSLDEAVFAQLTYSKIKEREPDEYRYLPDALDLPAALGSEAAYEILEEKGDTKFKGYDDNLKKAQSAIESNPGLWSGSLYAGWVKTLTPLLGKKGEGYPSFMTNDAWEKKSLESFLGSWSELKHDSILYSKQMMAEMGGGDEEILDDRGYVEPVPELYFYLSKLSKQTADGLKSYGLLDSADETELNRLAELSDKLCAISVKELTNELPTDEEFDLIRDYGGDLEHFWNEVIKDQTGEEYNYCEEYPAALIADVATDPNGAVLEEGIGGVSAVMVIVPVDGTLRLARGSVFNYYQFDWPMSDRLTDEKWRDMIGMTMDENYERHPYEDLDSLKPDWTKDYRKNHIYEDYNY